MKMKSLLMRKQNVKGYTLIEVICAAAIIAIAAIFIVSGITLMLNTSRETNQTISNTSRNNAAANFGEGDTIPGDAPVFVINTVNGPMAFDLGGLGYTYQESDTNGMRRVWFTR